MIPKIGQRIWTISKGGDFSPGRYTGTVLGLSPKWGREGWWLVDFEGLPKTAICHQDHMHPFDELPEQREQLGNWDLCPWRPSQVTVTTESR